MNDEKLNIVRVFKTEKGRKISEALKGKKKSEEHKRKLAINRTGKKLSEETKKKISEATKGENNPFYGKCHTDETKAKISNINSGRIVPEKLREQISEKLKGLKRPEFSDEWKQNISKGSIGKKLSEETKKKISIGGKGRICSEETRKKMSIHQIGENNNMFGRTGESNPLFGRTASEESRIKMSESKQGDKGPNWLGGISFLLYCYKFNRKLKEAIRNRDNRICQLCDCKENGEKLAVHHIHYDKDNCYPDLISLCCNCHSKVNFNRKYHESLFMNKLNERGLLFWTKRSFK